MLTLSKHFVNMYLQFEMFQTIHKGIQKMKKTKSINKINKATQVKTSECGDGSLFFVIDNIESILDFPNEIQTIIKNQADKIDEMMKVLSKTELLKKNAPATRLELDIDLEIEKFNQILDKAFDDVN